MRNPPQHWCSSGCAMPHSFPTSSRCLLSFLGSRSQHTHIVISESLWKHFLNVRFLLSCSLLGRRFPSVFNHAPGCADSNSPSCRCCGIFAAHASDLPWPPQGSPKRWLPASGRSGICSIRSPTGTARELLLWLSHPRVTDASPGFKKPQGFDCFVHNEGEGDNAGHACVRRWMRQSFFYYFFPFF